MENWTTVLPWVQMYLQKEDPLTKPNVPKASGTCNDGPRYGEAVTLVKIHVACTEQPICQHIWEISVALNHYCKRYDFNSGGKMNQDVIQLQMDM